MHVSGSAYKIVNKRAYHHGTMLISTELGSLGQYLKVEGKDTMETKGVASIRSPVANLIQSDPRITHDAFVRAIVSEFRSEYDVDVDDEIRYINENDFSADDAFIHKGVGELKSWGWKYGQTPEFTYTISHTFEWGTVEAEIKSKHGVILSCIVSSPFSSLGSLGDSFVGQRYGFFEGNKQDRKEEDAVRQWLVRTMQT